MHENSRRPTFYDHNIRDIVDHAFQEGIARGENKPIKPSTRFRFPIEISWEEINLNHKNPKQISFDQHVSDLIIGFFAETDYFYIFGDSGKWGMYAPNDDINPINVISCAPEYEKAFSQYLFQLHESKNMITQAKEWLPTTYKPYARFPHTAPTP